MNVIERVKQILTDCEMIKEFTNEVNVDFNENSAGNFGLYSTGDTLIKVDILGNQKRRHNFVLYAVNQSFSNYDRLKNSNFLLQLSHWMEFDDVRRCKEVIEKFYPNGKLYPDENLFLSNGGSVLKDETISETPIVKELKGEITKMWCENGMLYDVVNNDYNDGVTYQLQIYVEYELKER